MSDRKKVADLMVPLYDYPHVPYWFTLSQAMTGIRETAIKFEANFVPGRHWYAMKNTKVGWHNSAERSVPGDP